MNDTKEILTIEQRQIFQEGEIQALWEIVNSLMIGMNLTSEGKKMICGSLPRDLGTTKPKIVVGSDDMPIINDRDVYLSKGYNSVIRRIIGE